MSRQRWDRQCNTTQHWSTGHWEPLGAAAGHTQWQIRTVHPCPRTGSRFPLPSQLVHGWQNWRDSQPSDLPAVATSHSAHTRASRISYCDMSATEGGRAAGAGVGGRSAPFLPLRRAKNVQNSLGGLLPPPGVVRFAGNHVHLKGPNLIFKVIYNRYSANWYQNMCLSY